MNAIGHASMLQYHPQLNPYQNVHTKSSASEEANESSTEKAAEAKGTTSSILDRYA